MSKFEVRLQHVANFFAGVTGVLYGWFRYGVTSPDPYSAAPNPWEPWFQSAHVLLSPLLLFAVGMIWNGHVEKNYYKSKSPRRMTGISMALLLLPMAVTGYLVQVSTADGWRRAWAAGHWAFSGIWIAGYLGHMITPKSKIRRRLK